MDSPQNFADHLMDPTSQICTQERRSEIYLTTEDFQTAIQQFELPTPDCSHQPHAWTGDQNGSLDIPDFEMTPSMEAIFQKLADQTNPVDIDHITPSIGPLTRQPAFTAQQPDLDADGQYQRGQIRLPNSSTLAMVRTTFDPSVPQQGILESPTPIAVINPLTIQRAPPATPTTTGTNPSPHHIQTQVLTVPAELNQPANDPSQVAVPTANRNDPTLVTSMPSPEQPAAQSKSKKKSKPRKKRTRAEKKTPTSSPSSSLVMEKKKQKMTDNEEYQLPPDKELRIQLFYQNYKLKDEKVNSQGGFLVYHKKAWRFSNTDSELGLTNIEFPQLEKKLTMTNSQKNSTEVLLDAMTKGVHVYHDEFNNIYAERFCRSHVMCYTTDLGEDDITNNVLQRRDLVYQIKLEQGRRIKVFDNYSYQKKLVQRFLQSIPIKSPPPFIILTFGQTWADGFPLSNNLVYTKITPLRPREQYSAEKTQSFDCDKASLLTSFSSLSMN